MNKNIDNKKFYVIGLNYKKADVKTRSNFSLSLEKQKQLLQEAKTFNIKSLIILSTCNRIEIIGFANHPFELISLLCEFSNGTVEEFAKVSYVHKNSDAAEHIIRIATGIESQILGDYEIVGQLKDAFKIAKKEGTINAYLERLFNIALQASKETKNKTSLSSGTTTVSYAAIQYIKDVIKNYNDKKILIYGLGAIGDSTAKSSIKYLTNKSITVINRTDSKAITLSNTIAIKAASHKNLKEEIQLADIIIVATGASKPTITLDLLDTKKEQLIIDLSIPRNVDRSVEALKNKTIIDVDMLSKKTKETLEIRKKQVPLAEKIIQKYKAEFYEWLEFRRSTPAINALKNSLENIQKDAIFLHAKKHQNFNTDHAEEVTSLIVNKIVSKFAMHLKDDNSQTNQSIQMMKQIFKVEV